MSTTTSTDDQGVTDGVQEKAQQVAGQAQEALGQAATQARSSLRDQLDQRSSQVAEQINEQASDLRSVSESLRQQGKDGPAGAADRLAEYAERVGGYLRGKDAEALLADAEDFGRRQPWAVAGGALVLGFAASRFLKASSGQRYATRRARGAGNGTRGGDFRPKLASSYGEPGGSAGAAGSAGERGIGPDSVGEGVAPSGAGGGLAPSGVGGGLGPSGAGGGLAPSGVGGGHGPGSAGVEAGLPGLGAPPETTPPVDVDPTAPVNVDPEV